MDNKWLKLIAIDLTIITVLFVVFAGFKMCKCHNKNYGCDFKQSNCKLKCSPCDANVPSHFEFLVNDVDKAQKFYGEVFGWKFNKDKKYDYTMIEFGKKYPVCGGLMKKPANVPMSTTTMYFKVKNIDETVAKIEKIGGKLLMPKTEIEGYGFFAVCADSENIHFGIWQDKK